MTPSRSTNGWSLVGRSNGYGEFGKILDFELVNGVPVVTVDDPKKGKISFESRVDDVRKGQTRIVKSFTPSPTVEDVPEPIEEPTDQAESDKADKDTAEPDKAESDKADKDKVEPGHDDVDDLPSDEEKDESSKPQRLTRTSPPTRSATN